MTFPLPSKEALTAISAGDVLALLRKIETRDANDTALPVRQRTSAVLVYDFAIDIGIAEGDPAAIVKGAMEPIKKEKQLAIFDLDKSSPDAYQCRIATCPSVH